MNNLVLQLLNNRNYNLIFGRTQEQNEELIILVENNIHTYRNLILEDIYHENDWYRMKHITNPIVFDFGNYSFLEFHKKNYMILINYKCLKTNSIGYTFQYKFNEILHPFHIVKHNFSFVDTDYFGVNYKCKQCNISGFRKRGVTNNEILVKNEYIHYSCNEFLIKNIIE